MPLTKSLPYTEEDTISIVTRYRAGETTETISESTGRSHRSIIAKLSREGVYVSKTKPPSTRATKVELITNIAEMLNLDVNAIATIEKATHDALQQLHDAIELSVNDRVHKLSPATTKALATAELLALETQQVYALTMADAMRVKLV